MKISLNTLRYLDAKYGLATEPAPDGAGALVHKISSQLGGVEEVIEIGKKYDGVVIVKVISCEQHPNADRLHVCTIDDGGVTKEVNRDENGLVQVVCGAPNVAAGVTVAWLPPGATVPSSYNDDPFVLEARELRGVVSNGMLASPKELAIGDSHEGLLIINEDVAPGTMFADKYGLRGDTVIDIENKMFTHRPDCFGWIGVAREIAGIQGQQFHSPEWYRSDVNIVPQSNNLKVEVRNEIPELVPRFVVVPIAGITVAPSPVWLQVELAKVGLRPINNVVDLTNYYMLLTGQPLHAYDYDKVVAQDADASDHATLVVRRPYAEEKLTLLNGKEIQPRSEAILIATNQKAIGLGGVMGGADTEVDDTTTNIILECASFNMYSIRRTSMAHGIFSDAVTRFTKGQSPLQNMAVLAKIAEDVQQICGGEIAGEVIDTNNLSEDSRSRQSLYPPVAVSTDFINQRLGFDLSADEISSLLQNVEFAVHNNDGQLTVQAPFWRTDIEIPEDVVEEVGRLYGFDKLPLQLPTRSISPSVKNHMFETHAAIRDRLSSAGANELLAYSFVHGNLLQKASQDATLAYTLGNALSPDLQHFRLSLTPSLLASVHPNIKAGYDEFALFEIGKAHGTSEQDEDGLPKELGRLGLVYVAADKKEQGSKTTAKAGAPYYQARKYLETLLPARSNLAYIPLHTFNAGGHVMFEQMSSPFDPKRSAVLFDADTLVGIVGEYKPGVRKALKLPAQSAGFEIFLSYMDAKLNTETPYVPLPRFPKVIQDISLKVSAVTPYAAVHDAVLQAVNAANTANLVLTLSPLDIYQRAEDMEHKQITLRLEVQSYDKTMKDAEVVAILDTAAHQAHEQLGADRI